MSCEITYEELAVLTGGDSPDGWERIKRHAVDCPACQRRLAALNSVDLALRRLRPETPSAGTMLAVRRLLSEETRPKREPEVMTLQEVAEFLRIPLEELAVLSEELPAFELGGQIRVRRSKLLEWVEQRERRFALAGTASSIARIQHSGLRKGVA